MSGRWRSRLDWHRVVVGALALGLVTAGMVFDLAAPASATTWTVTNCTDSGPGSLRQTVADAGSGDTISFAMSPPCSTITLTSGDIDITSNLTIEGPGPDELTISGDDVGQAFVVGIGVIASISGLSIQDCTGGDNPPATDWGGAIFNDGTLDVNDTIIEDNTADLGGGIANDMSGALTVTNSTISDNTADSGGGIYNVASLTVVDSTVSDNVSTVGGAGGDGGGISNEGTANISGTTISGNNGWAGGGLLAAGPTTLSNSTVWGNAGGGVLGQTVSLVITEVTIAGNTATTWSPSMPAPGLYDFDTSPKLTATIIADNPSADCGGTPSPSVVDEGYNLDDDGTCGFSAPSQSLSDIPAGLDPAGLQENGGPTGTVALEPGSGAIEEVTNSTDCAPTDQRGDPRTAPCDIGAYDTDTATSQSPQTPAFASTPPSDAIFGGSYLVSASPGASGNPVSFFSSSQSVCTVSGATVSFVGVGSCTVDADESGNATYAPAVQIQQTFSVAPQSQSITFSSSPPSDPIVGGTSYSVSATGGGSGDPVAFSSATTGVCTVSGSLVSFVGVGTCTVDANQAGDADYSAAPQVQQSFTVGQGDQSITFTSTPPNNAEVRGPVYEVTATGGGSSNPIVFSTPSASACVVSDSTASFPASGTCTIYANQDGNENYTPAPEVSQSFAVSNVQGFSSGNSTSIPAGSTLSFSVNTTGLPVPALTEGGKLPKGVHFVNNHDGDGSLNGVPASTKHSSSAGSYPLTFTATFGKGKHKLVVKQAFTLTVT